MLALSILLTLLAAAIHSYMFYLEVLSYGGGAFRRVFRQPEQGSDDACTAFNRLAAYNLVLAISAVAGVLLRAASDSPYWQGVGDGMVCTVLLIIAVEAARLFTAFPDKRHIALIQGIPAVLGGLCLLLA